MTTTSLMRTAWAPACTGPFARLALHGEGVVTVRATTVPAWKVLNDVLIKHDYETRQADTGAYNCRKITGGTNYSLHAYGIAVDLNWQSNPYGPTLITDMPIKMVEDIESIRTNSGHRVFRWGGRYSGNKDAMHFEIICTPQQLATGIKTSFREPEVKLIMFPPNTDYRAIVRDAYTKIVGREPESQTTLDVWAWTVGAEQGKGYSGLVHALLYEQRLREETKLQNLARQLTELENNKLITLDLTPEVEQKILAKVYADLTEKLNS